MIDITKAFLGMTREEMFKIFGEPTDIGEVDRKYKVPFVYKYGQYEFGFGPIRLFYLMDTGKSGRGHKYILTQF